MYTHFLLKNTGDVEQPPPEQVPLYKQLNTELGNSIAQMGSSHNDIHIEPGFQGKECRLKCAHGTIHTEKPIMASHSIDMQTTHRAFDLKTSLFCSKNMRLSSSHGALQLAPGNQLVAKDIELKTAHAPILLNGSRIDAKTLRVNTSHSRISMDNVYIESELVAKSSHAPIDIHIRGIYSNCASIRVSSSHAPVNVHLPRDFSGKFYIKTSRSAANIMSSSRDVSFVKNTDNEKEGIVGEKRGVEVRIETSSSPIHLYI